MSDKQNSLTVRIAVFSLAVVFLSVGSASAEEYASGAGALEYFDADARAAISPQLKAWLMLLLGTFAGSLMFAWKHPIARWALGGIIVAMAAGHTVFDALGLPMLGGSIAIWHIVCWTPVLILLLIKRPFLNPEEGRWFCIWSAMLTAVIVISFLFDSVHAATYIKHFSGLGGYGISG